MPAEPAIEAPVYQCRHIFTDGHRCGSRALRKENFCYYHHATRRPAPRQTGGLNDPFQLPLPEDRSAIQASIAEIVQRIAANAIDPRRAGLLLYALQIASCNLPKPTATTETIDEVVDDPRHGPLAPIAEVAKKPHEKTLEEILTEQWELDAKQWQEDQLKRERKVILSEVSAANAVEESPQPSTHLHSRRALRLRNRAAHPAAALSREAMVPAGRTCLVGVKGRGTFV